MHARTSPLRRAGWLGASLLAFVSPAPALAEPVPSRIVVPPHTTTAEAVSIVVGESDATVIGKYRFRVAPDAPARWLRRPFRLALQLPVPVPRTLNRFEDIEATVRPSISIKGQAYKTEKGLFQYGVATLPAEARLAIFFFRVERDDLEGEFEVVMEYRQPVITTGGRDMVYYVPFLPTYEKFRATLGLKPESFVVTFESPANQTLLLTGANLRTSESGPHRISLQPRHLEVIGVEVRSEGGRRSPPPTRAVPLGRSGS